MNNPNYINKLCPEVTDNPCDAVVAFYKKGER